MKVKYGKQIDNDKSWIHVTVSIGEDEYPFNHVAPSNLSEEALLEYANKKESYYKLCILKDLYPDAPRMDDLSEFEEWITKGCKIPAVTEKNEYDEDVIVKPELVAEKKEWTITHPRKSLEERIEELETKVAVLEKR